MGNDITNPVQSVIDYIEAHLDGKLELEQIAEAVHYSKYHLHRMFIAAVGMTIHDYAQRRQLTEAAKLLVFSDKPIIEIALICGYESQQAFSSIFKSMYKITPAAYREKQVFYPLQLRFALHKYDVQKRYTKANISFADETDIPAWMDLMRLVIDGYPVMDEQDYLRAITTCIVERRALVLREDDMLLGAMAFSNQGGCIDFLGVHPQYRNQGIQRLFLDALLDICLPGQEISMTTFREGDKADTGYRELLKHLGFAERELLMEYGYPTQRFVLSAKRGEEV